MRTSQRRPVHLLSLSWTSRRRTLACVVDGIDLTLLSSALRTVDYASVARRRRLYDRLYHEALVSDEPGRGMSFTNMLLLLAHYKLIDDDEALECVDLGLRWLTSQAARPAPAQGSKGSYRGHRPPRPDPRLDPDHLLAAPLSQAPRGCRGCRRRRTRHSRRRRRLAATRSADAGHVDGDALATAFATQPGRRPALPARLAGRYLERALAGQSALADGGRRGGGRWRRGRAVDRDDGRCDQRA